MARDVYPSDKRDFVTCKVGRRVAIDNDNESGTYLFTGPGTASSERAATQVTTDFADLQVVAARRSATLRLALTVNADGDVGYVGTGRVRADCFRGSAKNRVRWSTATGKREGGGSNARGARVDVIEHVPATGARAARVMVTALIVASWVRATMNRPRRIDPGSSLFDWLLSDFWELFFFDILSFLKENPSD